MNIQNIHIDHIRPYWRNPRKNEKAVEAVKKSIEEYGFNSPIVVDKNFVIIAGHVRYKALRELGYSEVPCVVLDISEEKAKQYRIADNKTSELADWDTDKLMFELREIEELKNMDIFFKENELEKLLPDLSLLNSGFAISDTEKKEIEQKVRGQIIEEVGQQEPTEQIEKQVEERVRQEMEAELKKRLEAENKRIQQLEEKMKRDFELKSRRREEDYVEVECPYCCEKYILSKSELRRASKLQ